jgi:hypothetical protein
MSKTKSITSEKIAIEQHAGFIGAALQVPVFLVIRDHGDNCAPAFLQQACADIHAAWAAESHDLSLNSVIRDYLAALGAGARLHLESHSRAAAAQCFDMMMRWLSSTPLSAIETLANEWVSVKIEFAAGAAGDRPAAAANLAWQVAHSGESSSRLAALCKEVLTAPPPVEARFCGHFPTRPR